MNQHDMLTITGNMKVGDQNWDFEIGYGYWKKREKKVEWNGK